VVRRGVMRQASRLTAEAAEAWCLENLAAPVAGVAPDRRFVIRLEVRQADLRNAKPVLGEPGLSLTSLVDMFSRPARAHEPHWAAGNRSVEARRNRPDRAQFGIQVNRVRYRLLAAFIVATLAPLAVTLWITDALFERSLRYANTKELDELSLALQRTGREYYQRVREALKAGAASGRVKAERFGATNAADWPAMVAEFWESGEAERFHLREPQGDRLEYLVRRPDGVLVYSERLGGVGMSRLSEQYTRARALVEAASTRDLRRGFTYTFACSRRPPGWPGWEFWFIPPTGSAVRSSA